MVDNVAAVASAPLATDPAARSSWRVMAASSSSSSSRISLAESLSGEAAVSATAAAAGTLGSTAGEAGSGTRFRNKPNAMGALKVEIGWAILSSGHEVMVNNCLIFRHAALLSYPKRCQIFD